MPQNQQSNNKDYSHSNSKETTFLAKENISIWKKRIKYTGFHIKHFWIIFIIGQILSLMITASSIFTAKLSDYHINIPTFQTLINYILLGSIYTSFTIYLNDFKKWTKMILKDGWKYVILAFIDIEANYFVVKAYQYTNLLSCILLDSFSIITVILLSYFFLKVRYNISQILGILICFGGLITLTISDFKLNKYHNFTNIIKGDIFIIIGACLYGLSNVLQEFFLSKRPIYEVIGQLGFWGIFIDAIQISLFEKKHLKETQWSKKTIGFIFGYNIALFIFYSLSPVLFKISGALFYNMSLLTSDFWSLIIGIYLFHYSIYWLYYIAFILVILGLLTYHLFFKDESKKPWIDYNHQEINDIEVYNNYKISK
ncbi:hypothetical protein PNEG_01190 [Pneumocystis murina B123]|uniref:EamA domain-containing protein n=1 Tax=Pneumocystis murina (strain B123) TaxID=1069680 RepID=M7NT66_PNEMU|nr:hypothetical protein PNEG_01190 [Pneumocystis murina B123]EMR10477.1 hypothetical protein PNEG_01190 [Pneumocystis murina B123]